MEEERFNFIWKNYCYKNACYSQAHSDRSDYSSPKNIYRSTEKTVLHLYRESAIALGVIL